MTTFHSDIRTVASKLKSDLPSEIVEKLLSEYVQIKHQFALGHHRAGELSGGHFAELITRLIQHIHTGSYTPLGDKLNMSSILGSFATAPAMPEGLRRIAPRLVPVMADVRNTRGVGHPGHEVDANYSDSIFIVHCANWLMTEIIRHFYACPIGEAQKIVANINQSNIPAIFDLGGTPKILNTKLSAKDKTLLLLYYKHPEPIKEDQLFAWVKYSQKSSYKRNVLKNLDDDALIHLESGNALLTPRGIRDVERRIPLEIEL